MERPVAPVAPMTNAMYCRPAAAAAAVVDDDDAGVAMVCDALFLFDKIFMETIKKENKKPPTHSKQQ